MKKGLLNLERLLEVDRPVGRVVLLPRIDVLLDFPLSIDVEGHRLHESITGAVDRGVEEPVESVEGFLAGVAKEVLKANPQAQRVEARLEADYVVLRRTPVSGLGTQEMYKILSHAITENGRVRKMIGAEVNGITACPCAQEGVMEQTRERLLKDFSEEQVRTILENVVIATHNQRNTTSLLIEVPEEFQVEVEDLMEIIEASMSSRLYEVLKREDEVNVVVESHRSPSFVEDVVREVLVRVDNRYKDLPGETTVYVKSESHESIHQHNAIAERTVVLEDLRQEIPVL
ncbi:MAG: GTP cyclohydrolase I FolE2 [Euryarchaeota archaeon]|nr:GTP cyclohydrolase I FolE2 [Euryarchaeota archaeon]